MAGYNDRLQRPVTMGQPVTMAGYKRRLQWAVSIRLQSARSALHQPINPTEKSSLSLSFKMQIIITLHFAFAFALLL